MKRSTLFRFVLAMAAIAMLAGVGSVVVNRGRNNVHISKTALVSDSGKPIESLFAGLPTVPAYLNGKMYRRNGFRSRGSCSKTPNVIERAAIRIGLERVVRAQSGCDPSICLGCWAYVIGSTCTGACEGGGTVYTANGGGTICSQGTNFAGPACGVDNNCGCNFSDCRSSQTDCGC